MRLQLVLILLITNIFVNGSFAQPRIGDVDFRLLDDSAKMSILQNVNFDRYVGKKVRSFIANDTIKYFHERSFIESKPYFLSGLELEYSAYIYVKVYIGKAKHQKLLNLDSRWDYHLLKKERITDIKLLWGSTVIKSTRNKKMEKELPSIME